MSHYPEFAQGGGRDRLGGAGTPRLRLVRLQAGLPRPRRWRRLGAQVVERPFRCMLNGAGEGKGGSGAAARQPADPGCSPGAWRPGRLPLG